MSANFSSYETEDWKKLFQSFLVSLLPNFNQTLLQLLPMDITCSSYQEIVKGFSTAYESLPTQTREDVFIYLIRRYLTHQSASSVVPCNAPDIIRWLDINFGNFKKQATTEFLVLLNKEFTKIMNVTELNPGDLANFTLIVDSIQDSTLTTSFLSQILQFKDYSELQEYLLTIQKSICQKTDSASEISSCDQLQLVSNLSIGTQQQLLTNVFIVLGYDWSLSNMSQWLQIFYILINDFSSALDQTHISQLPLNISCGDYQAIIKKLSDAYIHISGIESSVNSYCKRYLTQQTKYQGSACLSGTSNSKEWIKMYFGEFLTGATVSELMQFYPNFDVAVLTDVQNASEMAELLTKADVLSNDTILKTIFSNIEAENITDYVNAIDTAAEKATLSESQLTTVKDTLLTVIFTKMSANFSSYKTEDWKKLFQSFLVSLLPNFNQTLLQLLPMDITCSSYQEILKGFNNSYDSLSMQTKDDVYKIYIKKYLSAKVLATDSKPKCYNNSETGANSWLSTYLGNYLTFCSAEDLKSFSDDEKLLQGFSVDPVNLELVKRLKLSEDFKMYYAELIAADNSIAPDRIPPNILCYAIGMLNTGNLNTSQALNLLNSLKECGDTMETNVFASLLTSLGNITTESLVNLGPLITGLPTSVILQKMTGSIILENLNVLSQYTWSQAQASAIVEKLDDFKINSTNVLSLGKLIIGVKAYKMDNLTNEEILNLASNQNFTTYMEQAPIALRQRFVQMVIKSKPGDILSVPDNLASEIPLSQLLTSFLHISEINQKKLTSEQARGLFQMVLSKTENYSELSKYILQGFTGGAAKNLSNIQFVSLIKSMKNKTVTLDDSQLNYIAKKITIAGAPKDFANYSSDVLLFIGPKSYTDISDCRQYFILVGQSKVELLLQGSPKRTSFLSSAKTCLNISNQALTKDNIQDLGSLACDLNDQEIKNSDPYILIVLQSCSSFTNLQKKAIESQLINKYGLANTWTTSTMQNLGNLASVLTSSTLTQIPPVTKLAFFPGFLTSLKKQDKTSFSSIMIQLKSPINSNRAATCTNITTDMISKQKDLLVLSYTSSELVDCLNTDVLRDNLDTLGALEFSDDQLKVLKDKLNQAFPNGIAEDYLVNLGNIARMYTVDEIAKWNITSVDTLSALIEKAPWQNNDEKVNALVTRYLLTPGAILDSTTLTVIASYICSLKESQINGIKASNIRESSKSPNISSCSQNKKNLIFEKMKAAFPLAKSQNSYYQYLLPVIGGAKAEDLIQLAAISPEMDVRVFAILNQDEVKNLSAQDIKNLLGDNLSDISSISDSAVIQSWVSVNNQTDVNSLGLNSLAGIKEPTPEGFIVLQEIISTGGTTPQHALSVLFTCTVATILLIHSTFL